MKFHSTPHGEVSSALDSTAVCTQREIGQNQLPISSAGIEVIQLNGELPLPTAEGSAEWDVIHQPLHSGDTSGVAVWWTGEVGHTSWPRPRWVEGSWSRSGKWTIQDDYRILRSVNFPLLGWMETLSGVMVEDTIYS